MSKHKDKDKERSRDDRYSRERERSRDRERRKKSRSRSRDRHKRSKDRRRSKEKSSRRERSREKDRERSRRSRSRHRRSETPPTVSAPQRIEMSVAQQAQITQFLSASLSGIQPPTTEFRMAAEQDNSASGNCGDASNSESDRKRKRKSRWASSNDGNEKTFIPGMPTILPSNLNPDQQEAYLVQLQIEEISRKLRTGDLGISQNLEERSPSPEPIYSSDGKRLNTREFRTRKKLEEQRHMLITRMQCMNPDFKPPADYKPPVLRVSDKVLIPQEEHPDINFVGLLIGPRGNTLKAMEKDTGAKIIIRGKGSVKEGKVGRKDGQPLPGEDEPLHAFITASNPEAVKKAVDKIKEVIKQGIEVPEGHNDLRRMQLRELAQLNGTLRETDNARCTNCGSTDHKSWLCPDKPNVTNSIVCSSCGGAGHIAKDCKSKRPGMGGVEGSNNQAKIDEEYLSLMAELGEVQPQEAPVQPREPVQPTPRPYSIFDNPRQQAPRQICAPPPPNQPPIVQNSGPPQWHPNQHPPAPPMPLPPVHPMGQYPPPMPSMSWNANPPLPPGPIHPPGISPSIPPPPGTDLAPPGTFGSFDDGFGKKPPTNWSVPPPMPGGNFWNQGSSQVQPPLPSFLVPPPPPPAD
ncbi:CLUMA_CG002213, isoform B [Clunio marinus]|uniref:Branchpoint-bridging protein n=1 Tax=Clunio marinus TaxID=568069 RepID=A0A1J1HM87_9DIPT|nr:CLUMA_CG002213, isoform B [Clunio marinus]